LTFNLLSKELTLANRKVQLHLQSLLVPSDPMHPSGKSIKSPK